MSAVYLLDGYRYVLCRFVLCRFVLCRFVLCRFVLFVLYRHH
jgi:hypothetical protein